MNTERRLQAVAIMLLLVLGLGTLGFMVIEHWQILDAIYMTIITISTVGFGEVHRLSAGGRAFASVLIILGVGATFYAMTLFFELLVEGQIRGVLGKRRVRKGIRRMKDHDIVCGYGRVGKQVVDELIRRGRKVVVVETDPARIEELTEAKIPFVPGNATEEKTLESAGIQTARALIVAVPGDADIVFITLSARQLNSQLRIVARADEDNVRDKVQLAGADAVVCPHEIGGKRMALATMTPNVLDFMQITGSDEESGIRIDEIQVDPESPLCGKTLMESAIKSEMGLTVVGLRKGTGEMRVNPGAGERVEANDILVVIGPSERLSTVRKMTAAPPN